VESGSGVLITDGRHYGAYERRDSAGRLEYSGIREKDIKFPHDISRLELIEANVQPENGYPIMGRRPSKPVGTGNRSAPRFVSYGPAKDDRKLPRIVQRGPLIDV
jgi:hypothetical protein